MSSGINDGTNGVRFDVPQYFLSEYPLFVEFLDTFMDWMYNKQSMTQEELASYLSDTSWFDTSSTRTLLEQLIDLKGIESPGSKARDFLPNHFLARDFDALMALDNDELLDADGRPVFGEMDRTNAIQGWYDSFNFQLTADYSFEFWSAFTLADGRNFRTSDGAAFSVPSSGIHRRSLDHRRWLKLLRHVYRIRGTQKAMELFFWIYFGTPVRIKYPKESIATLDDNFVLDDSSNTLRDDNYFNEFSYVIQVPRSAEKYQEAFDRIYRLHFHPSGFTAFLESLEV